MSAGGRNAPLSPISVGGSEWSLSKYPSRDEGGGPYPNSRGNLASPPNSGGSIGNMSMNGFPSAPRSNGGPSPPPSIGRSSTGTNVFSGGSDNGRGSGRPTEIDESILNEHYNALRNFLEARDSNARSQPNKARDKLVRLSSVQFFELSTDVFDELMRRLATARTPPNAPNRTPQYLLPEKAFHPKRNQARQRLSSLGPPRFRDLAADVYHELERRFPTFIGRDIPRGGSGMSMRGPPRSRTGTPANGNIFPPRGPSSMRRPSDASSMRGPPPADAYGMPPSPGLPNGDYGRPLPKQLNQNNTIVPNKSTMLEEDDEGATISEVEKKQMEDQIKKLQGELATMEDAMKKKDDEVTRMTSALDEERSRTETSNLEKSEWTDLRQDLETKLTEAQVLNKSMKMELERMRSDHEQETRQLRNEASRQSDTLVQRENEKLRGNLRQQEEVTEDVRREATGLLQEMKMLSQQSNARYEKQLELENTNEQLEREVQVWRNRYANLKAQQGGRRASSTGLQLNSHDILDKHFIDTNGLIEFVHVIKFQMAIDEMLKTTRSEASEKVIDTMMKSVVRSVRRITQELDEQGPPDAESAQQQGQLKARISSTANAFITASKSYGTGGGLTPISVIDAAVSNLMIAIIGLVRVVKIKPAADGVHADHDDGMVTPVDSASFSPRSTTQGSTQGSLPPPPPFQGLGGVGARASAESSAYSPISSPRESVDPYPIVNMNGIANGTDYLGLGKGPNGYHDPRANTYSAYSGI